MLISLMSISLPGRLLNPMTLKLLQYLPNTPEQFTSELHSPQWPVTATIAENRHSPNRPTFGCGVRPGQK